MTLEQEILEQISRLTGQQKQRVLDFVRTLNRPSGESGHLFIERTKHVHIDPAELYEITQAIEEGCEQIEDDRDEPRFPD